MNHTIDLHLHSTASDGTLSPTELAGHVAQYGVDLIALTDHDCIAGLGECRSAANRLGIRFIDGVELSANWKNKGVHIIGLDFDPDNGGFRNCLTVSQCIRHQRNEKIAAKLGEAGIAVPVELYRDKNTGRSHFAKYLSESGQVRSPQQAFKRYLGDGKSASVETRWPDLTKILSIISAAGGYSVLAHPEKYKLTMTGLNQLISDFASSGGDALELDPTTDSGGQQQLICLCRKHRLRVSFGSDFHSPDQFWLKPGRENALPGELEAIWDLFA